MSLSFKRLTRQCHITTLETRGELGRVNVRKDFWDFEQRTSTGKELIAFLGSDFAPLFSGKSSL